MLVPSPLASGPMKPFLLFQNAQMAQPMTPTMKRDPNIISRMQPPVSLSDSSKQLPSTRLQSSSQVRQFSELEQVEQPSRTVLQGTHCPAQEVLELEVQVRHWARERQVAHSSGQSSHIPALLQQESVQLKQPFAVQLEQAVPQWTQPPLEMQQFAMQEVHSLLVQLKQFSQGQATQDEVAPLLLRQYCALQLKQNVELSHVLQPVGHPVQMVPSKQYPRMQLEQSDIPMHYAQLVSQGWQVLLELYVPRGQPRQVFWPLNDVVQLTHPPLQMQQVLLLSQMPKPRLQFLHCELLTQVTQKLGQGAQSAPSSKNPCRQV